VQFPHGLHFPNGNALFIHENITVCFVLYHQTKQNKHKMSEGVGKTKLAQDALDDNKKLSDLLSNKSRFVIPPAPRHTHEPVFVMGGEIMQLVCFKCGCGFFPPDNMSEIDFPVYACHIVQNSVTDFWKGLEKMGRNDPCPCGIGKKFKNCHFLLNFRK
jgi:hypothetical protein